MEMNRILMIVDPQTDFITGTLPVPHAAEAMERLASYLTDHGREYRFVVVTSDWHPTDHCSFVENGGTWPAHCLQEHAGAALFGPLQRVLEGLPVPMEILHKGMDPAREEYSIFRNDAAAARIDEIIRTTRAQRIDLCGIAGDVCVLDTLRDGVRRYGTALFRVLEEYAPSLDGGTALHQTIQTLRLS